MLRLSSRFVVPLAILACATAVPAAAKDKEPAPPPVQIRELYACRDIGDAAARLSCFDREVGELAAADASREISFADKATVKKTRRELFGFVLPNLDGLIGDSEELASVETTISSAALGRNGKYRFELGDGSVWNQIDDLSLFRDPRPGQKIVIRSAALGSFLGKMEGERAIRMRRER